MSDTPRSADDCMKLLDAGKVIFLFKNGLGSYTAVTDDNIEAIAHRINDEGDMMMDNRTTDDFTPSQALYRLTEKAVHGRVV